MAYIARTNGKIEKLEGPINLETVKAALGGAYVEMVTPRHTKGCIFFCDEDGHSKQLPINVHGCMLYGSALNGHPIVGDIVVLETVEEKRRFLRG